MLPPAATGSGLSVLVTRTSAWGTPTVVVVVGASVVVVGGSVVVVVDVVVGGSVVVVGPAAAGPQLGSLSMALGAVGRRVMVVPSGVAVKMSGPLRAPKALDEKTIRVPSGDHAGSTELATTWTCPVPLALMTQTAPAFW